MKTWEKATGKWRGIFMHFGVDERYLTGNHCACPICGGVDRFRFDDKNGRGTVFCNTCGSKNGTQFLLHFTGKNYTDLMKEIDRIVGNLEFVAEKKTRNGRKINDYISSLLKPLGSINPVRTYLKNRGLTPSRYIKHCPSLGYFEGGEEQFRSDAMVVPFSNKAGNIITHHCTYLTPDGRKSDVKEPKKMLPIIEKLSGGVMRLTDMYDEIGIAEGVESALAVMMIYKIPCWASGNSNLLSTFDPPETIKKVTVYADNDINYAGQKAAYLLADRLQRKIKVEVEFPQEIGTDFADMVQA